MLPAATGVAAFSLATAFIQTLQTESLDKFVVCGTKHLDHLTAEYVKHFLRERPHMGLDSKTPAGPPIEVRSDPPAPSSIVCEQRLGGVLKHYRRKAA